MKNHQESFKGSLYAINPNVKKIPDFPQENIYKSILDVPEDIDFAFITVPAKQVLSVIDECVEKGVKLVSIFSAEFSVTDALIGIIEIKGTLIMPAFSSGNTDPKGWQYPPVPKEWCQIIREQMPAFHVDKTPTRGMGSIAETLRKYPGFVRSNHPVSSFSAWGKYAKYITQDHNLEYDLGEGSPLARIYELDGKMLLLGVDHSSNTSIHLAEYRSEYKEKYYKPQGSSILVENERQWAQWEELNMITDDFENLGREFETRVEIVPKKVGLAEARLFSQRDLVDFAADWIRKNRPQ